MRSRSLAWQPSCTALSRSLLEPRGGHPHVQGVPSRKALHKERRTVDPEFNLWSTRPSSASITWREITAPAASALREETQYGETFRMGRPSTGNPIITVAMLEKFASSFGQHFSTLLLPSSYFPENCKNINPRFSDASKDAIKASMYLQLFDDRGEISMTLLFGQSKVAPAQTTSIPCLELSFTVLASQVVHRRGD